MTRKDYVRLADGLGRALAMSRVLDAECGVKPGFRGSGDQAAWYAIGAMEVVLMMDNPRFSVSKFRDAVRDAADSWAVRLDGVAIG